jgi:hypothetical protein
MTMLTITDLSVSESLDAEALRAVRGGMALPGMPASFASIFNGPTIDAGSHFLNQAQALAVDQSGNLGGLNLVINDQSQIGVSGQVA